MRLQAIDVFSDEKVERIGEEFEQTLVDELVMSNFIKTELIEDVEGNFLAIGELTILESVEDNLSQTFFDPFQSSDV